MRHHRRQEPYAVMLTNLCGGGGQPSSLPRPENRYNYLIIIELR